MQKQTQERPLVVDAEIELPLGRVQVVRLEHVGPKDHMFRRENVYWVDLCLTPRRPTACARYIDRWGSHRFAEMGSIIALPPNEHMQLRSAGGRHTSVICQLRSDAVDKWLPGDFEWTDRRLEACPHIASERIRWLLLRLNQELRGPDVGTREIGEAITSQLSIELARYIVSVNEPTERGGLASWRLRVIDERIAEPREPPTLAELAELCRMSVRQLTRGFRTSRGCSVTDHLGQVRIDTAKRRLASSQESIATIATSLGYASQSSTANDQEGHEHWRNAGSSSVRTTGIPQRLAVTQQLGRRLAQCGQCGMIMTDNLGQ
jgi:AraC family transcriptional regulator